MYTLFFDVETTGLIDQKTFNSYPCPKTETYKYDKARIVSICMIFRNAYESDPIKFSTIIRPSGNYDIGTSSDIHNITRDRVEEQGVDLKNWFKEWNAKLWLESETSLVVGFNVKFDQHILLSEFYRNSMYDMYDIFKDIPTQCVMRMAMDRKLSWYDNGRERYKLSCVYKRIMGSSFNAHDCVDDTFATIECYDYMQGNIPNTCTFTMLVRVDHKLNGVHDIMSERDMKKWKPLDDSSDANSNVDLYIDIEFRDEQLEMVERYTIRSLHQFKNISDNTRFVYYLTRSHTIMSMSKSVINYMLCILWFMELRSEYKFVYAMKQHIVDGKTDDILTQSEVVSIPNMSNVSKLDRLSAYRYKKRSDESKNLNSLSLSSIQSITPPLMTNSTLDTLEHATPDIHEEDQSIHAKTVTSISNDTFMDSINKLCVMYNELNTKYHTLLQEHQLLMDKYDRIRKVFMDA
jgi:DNA polymerase III epsilon subunit-like protein